jgi:protein tyrosine phosphatase
MPTLQELPPGTKQKNRYVNVLPNEATRVPLTLCDDDPTSFFINANFVNGFKASSGVVDRHYVAAQGPLPTTMIDFWRMIWEHKIECLVMTTGLIEGNRRKCHRYWPDEETEPDGAEFVACLFF